MGSIEPAFLWLAGICSGLLAIWGVVSKVSQPYKDLSGRVKALEDEVESNKKKLLSDNEAFLVQEEYNRLSLETQLLLLQHAATGNHNEQMEKQADKLQAFLYSKSGKLK